MKRFLAPLTLLTLALAGCSPQTEAVPEDIYFELMADLPSFANVPDDVLTELGEGLCSVRDTADENDLSQTEAELRYLKMATDEGMEAGDIGAFFVYATATYCPQYVDGDSIRDLLD